MHKTCLGYVPISSNAPQPLGVAYFPILLSEVEQEQRPSGKRDLAVIVVGAGLCDREGERAYTGYAPDIIRNVSANVFSLRRFGIIFCRNVRRHVFAETSFAETSGIRFELVPVFGKFELSPFEIKIQTFAFELITVPQRLGGLWSVAGTEWPST